VGPGFWPLIALAGVLGGVMRSPFSGVLFALELTHQYAAVLPLIIGATTAFAVSALLLKRSVLTEKIARRGYHLTREYDVDPLEIFFVSEVMSDDLLEFTTDVTVAEAVATLGSPVEGDKGWRQRLYPVVDAEGHLCGVVTRRALLKANNRTDGSTPLAELMRDPVAVTHGDQTLKHVAALMAGAEVNRVPVTDRDDPRMVIGMVTLTQLLAARQRDQVEARERERVLRVRMVVPSWARR
jgi:CBS domain-containing protein